MIIIELLLLYFIVSLIGWGGSLWTFAKSYPQWVCFFIWAPLVGTAWLVLSGTLLVFCHYPIASWSNVLLLVSLVLSLGIGYLSYNTRPLLAISEKEYATFFRFFLYGGIFCPFALALPVVIGGMNFTLLRGNGTDAFNYIVMANFLDHVPYNVAAHASQQWLDFKHSFYALGQALILGTRWPVSMLLALFSRWLNLPVYKFEYVFSLFFLLLEYVAVYLFAVKCNLKPRVCALVSLAICLGFWAQWLVDIRAQAQISIMPVIIASLLLLVHVERKSREQYWKEGGLFACLVGTIVFLYIEVMPLLILAGMILLAEQAIRNYKNMRYLLGYYGAAFLLISLLVLPNYYYWINLLTSILHQAVSHKNNWEFAYFEWLYTFPLSGMWGLGIFSRTWETAIAIVMGLTLLLLSVFSLKIIIQKKIDKETAGIILLLSFVLSGIVSFLYLYWHHQYWAAGKAISYVYPFLMILPVWAMFSIDNTYKYQYFWSCVRVIVWIWLGIQVSFAGWHIYNTYLGKEYKHYMMFHGEYKQHVWSAGAIEKAVFLDCSTLRLDIANPWLKEYWSFVFSEQPLLIASSNASCVLMEKSSVLFGVDTHYLAQNGEVFLKQSTL